VTLTPVFPPLFSGLSTEDNPFTFAMERAENGCDTGLVTYNLKAHTLQAAMVLAPDVALKKAAIMMPICGIGFQNALGALAPPEVAVHLVWSGGIKVNGARCGDLRMAAASDDPEAVPDWLVVGVTLALWPPSDDPGDTPDQTALYSEGCADVDAVALLEAWVRHTLVWINRWGDEGTKPVHAEWRGLVDGLDEAIEQGGHRGKFIGVDEDFGMLLKDDAETHLVALTELLTRNDT
jgi:biotin-(acetyl-CoA carboxylase) ligase